MSASQRNKGAAGEREFLRPLGDMLGQPLTRNLGQTRDGGADCLDVAGFRVEMGLEEFAMVCRERLP